MEILEFKNYSFKYYDAEKLAISNINIKIYKGEFILLFGKSGAGKTTLLRSIKEELRRTGKSTGKIISNVEDSEISVVFQNPNIQLINSRVVDDLVFQMENIGYSILDIKRRLSETIYYFGIEDILHRDPETLSGGQKQLIALCSALMVRPKILLLDEPISQLDPMSSKKFFEILEKINVDFGVTIIMTEHKIDEAIKYSDKLVLMKSGTIEKAGDREKVIYEILENSRENFKFIPSIPRVSYKLFKSIKYTPKEFISTSENISIKPQKEKENLKIGKRIMKLRRVFFGYNSTKYVIKNISMEIYENERICLLGANGSGKTTLLKLLANIYTPTFGNIKSKNIEIGYLPQDINLFFSKDTVLEELELSFGKDNINRDYLDIFCLEKILYRNPRDISGGEQLKVAILSILGKKPDLIILDEPTKGLDIYSQNEIIDIIKKLDITIICSTHNLDFSCKVGTKSIMLFDGEVFFTESSREFLKYNDYYTTQLSLAIRNINRDIIIPEDIEYEN